MGMKQSYQGRFIDPSTGDEYIVLKNTYQITDSQTALDKFQRDIDIPEHAVMFESIQYCTLCGKRLLRIDGLEQITFEIVGTSVKIFSKTV
jgi:hypothetical protein